MFRRRLAYAYVAGAIGIGYIASRITLDPTTKWLLVVGIAGILYLGYDLYRMGTNDLRAKAK